MVLQYEGPFVEVFQFVKTSNRFVQAKIIELNQKFNISMRVPDFLDVAQPTRSYVDDIDRFLDSAKTLLNSSRSLDTDSKDLIIKSLNALFKEFLSGLRRLSIHLWFVGYSRVNFTPGVDFFYEKRYDMNGHSFSTGARSKDSFLNLVRDLSSYTAYYYQVYL